MNVPVPIIPEDAKAELKRLPFIQSTRQEIWRFLGFKHVNGPAKWSSYAKSQYIADVHRSFDVPLENIARQIGDTHKTVQRLFRGLMVVEQAERTKMFDREDRYNRHFAFSHMYTGLGYEGIATFLGLRPETEETEEPVPPEKADELREFCLWLYGSKKEGKRPVIQSQNPDLGFLNSVLMSGEAVAALRAGVDVRRAHEMSRPSSTVFEESLHGTKRELEKARSLSSTGYDGSEQLLQVADDICELAQDLYADMLRKGSPRRDQRASRRP